MFKIIAIFCVALFISETKAFAKRDVPVTPSPPNALVALQKNMEQFKNCIDQSLAQTVSQVNEQQLQPIFAVIGDTLNRVSKAFDDLTATNAPSHTKDE